MSTCSCQELAHDRGSIWDHSSWTRRILITAYFNTGIMFVSSVWFLAA